MLARGASVRAADLDPVHLSASAVDRVPLDFTHPRTFAAAVAGCAGFFLLRPPAIARVGPTLTGPEVLGFAEVATTLLAQRVGRPVRYEPATLAGYWRHLRRRGLPRAQVLVQTVIHAGLRRGDAEEVDTTLSRLLGRPARTLEEYIRDRFDVART